MPTLDATFLLIFASFLVFMLAMKALYFDPIQRIKKAREEKLISDRQQSQTSLQTYEELCKAYEVAIQDAQRKAQQVIFEYCDNAKKEASQSLAQVREQVQADVEKELQTLSEARAEAYQQLLPEKAAIADLILQKITGQSLKTPVA